MNRQRVDHGLAQVGKGLPPPVNRQHDGRKVVVQQHQGRALARHVGAALAHGDADVCRLEGRDVVHAVTHEKSPPKRAKALTNSPEFCKALE